MLEIQQKIPKRSGSIISDKQFTIVVVLFALLSAFLVQTHSAAAASNTAHLPLSGTCGVTFQHCYAQTEWHGNTGGAFTNLSPFDSLNCQGCNGFIDNEMWFSDITSSQCTSLPAKICWVESGISTYAPSAPANCNPGNDSTCLFWADNRPNGGGYHEWPLWTIGPDGTSLNPWGFDITIENNENNSSSGSRWEVNVEVYQNNNPYAGFTAFSTSNTMNTNDITVGSELSATSGNASAGTTDFAFNQWLDGNGNWRYQTATPTTSLINAPPPNGSWCWCSEPGGIFDTWD